MLPRRRFLLVMLAALVVAAPAAVLAGLCVGRACRVVGPPTTRVPFCSLGEPARALIAAGFRDGRSPHVLAVTGGKPVVGGSAAPTIPWPRIEEPAPVPLVFAGAGVDGDAEVPAGTTLDAVAPTLETVIGLRRPHPSVRSGEPIPDVGSGGERPRLVILVAWKNISSPQLERTPDRWPVLRGLIEDGAATLDAAVGSVPLDPAAVLTTIGTGALPADHGITGSLVRNDDGEVVRPWTGETPFSVVAALGDDLDQLLDRAPRIGLVASDASDRGLIGGNWYDFQPGTDDDDVVIERDPARQAVAAAGLVASGYGADAVTDLLAVTMEGPVAELDRALGRIVEAAGLAEGGPVTVAVTGTGSAPAPNRSAIEAADLERRVETALDADVVEATTPGGLFLDQDEMTRTGLSDDRVVAALGSIEAADGRPVFEDAFPALAVTFARYC